MGRTRETGDFGEYYVLYRLVKEGFVATLAPSAITKAIDILVSTADGLPSTVQVKAKRSTSDGWRLANGMGILRLQVSAMHWSISVSSLTLRTCFRRSRWLAWCAIRTRLGSRPRPPGEEASI
jgi:hypothetical protein